MLYKKNGSKSLDQRLFENPTSEYRGAPFWSWNCKLEMGKLSRQIDYLKEMGFGGFHMHPRSGMATEYLSKEFLGLIKGCVEKAKKEDMLAWLYDEDRWPSGAAGGIVTKNPKFRQKYLLFTQNKQENTVSKQEGFETAKPYFLAAYDISLNTDGELSDYRRIGEEDSAAGDKWHAYLFCSEKSGWYNNQTYVDTLSIDAMNEFINVTYEAYKKTIGDEFGNTVPAIFTDEPQFRKKGTLRFAKSRQDVGLPWTTDFDASFLEAYGFDIFDSLPELIWDLPGGAVSKTRYLYHEHVCERFTVAFSDNCGKWCAENGILLTGHMNAEQSLHSQTGELGEAMRAYRSFGMAGIDLLCDNLEFTTAKQAQSAARQYGHEGVLSELYGVTNWDFDFRGHKFQGDWQAALGVTVRVHHLSWVSMKGSAKRDYPASINYQSPWYKEYPYVENHFARLNTALTRGTPLVDVGVIHPVESYWLRWGPEENTADIRTQMDENFSDLINWLLFGLIDFDFISESLFPSQSGDISDRIQVGKMRYSTIVVPGCETIRRTTLDLLTKFKEKGGRIIFVGDCPKYVDAERSDDVRALYDASKRVPFARTRLLDALRQDRFLEIRGSDGKNTDNLIYTLRQDGDVKWLFIAHAKKHAWKDVVPPQPLTIKINGVSEPTLYDTVTGRITPMDYSIEDGKTVIPSTLYAYDSLLIRLDPAKSARRSTPKIARKRIGIVDYKTKVPFTMDEPNVYLLDRASYSLDGGPFEPEEDLLRLDNICRAKYAFPSAAGYDAQPWVIEEEVISHFITLQFEIESEIALNNPLLAAEEVRDIELNGVKVQPRAIGWYVDESIQTFALPALVRGTNLLRVSVPFGKRVGVEYCYLLGDFRVRVEGCVKTVVAPSDTIGFSSITSQGFPFYGGNIRYQTTIDTPDCALSIKASNYRGSLIKVLLDGKPAGLIVYAPYTLLVENVKKGTHTVEFILYGNRHNTFGSVHNSSGVTWYGPTHWYSTGEEWCYEYKLKETGILASPVIEILT